MRQPILLAGMIAAMLSPLMPVHSSWAAGPEIPECPESCPAIPGAGGGEPASYLLEYHFYNRGIGGKTRSRVLVTAKYERIPEEGLSFRWTDARISTSGGEEEPPRPGSAFEDMEGFGYTLSDDIMLESSFAGFEGEIREIAKTMVWDGMLIEMFYMMRGRIDSLPAGKWSPVARWEDADIRMGGWGMMRLRGLKVKWSGISTVAGETCALVDFKSFSNPVEAPAARGRSCYWGQVWFSIEDGDIECITMNEDIVLTFASPEGGGRILNMQRDVRFESAGGRSGGRGNASATGN